MKKKHVYAKAAPATAPRALTQPLEQLRRCPSCTGLFPLLVEGTDLCVRCDRRHFPELVVA